MNKAGLLLCLLACASAQAAPAHRCEAEARLQARRLLEFHFGADERISIHQAVKRLAPIKNPADRRQLFDVLEVWGGIYKGEYRMRLIYARLEDACVLMGQEVLEYARL